MQFYAPAQGTTAGCYPRAMKSSGFAVAAVLSALTVAGIGWAEDPEGTGVAWRTDLDAARTEAAETGRPLVVVFR